MSALEGPEIDGAWTGKAEKLLQQQLKNVQEECRQLRETYRRNGRLSRNSRSNSTQSLVMQSSRTQAEVSPPSHFSSISYSIPHPTPHSQNTHITPSLGVHLSVSNTSLSSLKSTQSELAPPTMTSLRPHQPPHYSSRHVSSTPQSRHGVKTSRKKTTTSGVVKKRGDTQGQGRVAGTTASSGIGRSPHIVESASSGQGERGEVGKQWSSRLHTYIQDSGYSSGSGTKPRGGGRGTGEHSGSAGQTSGASGVEAALNAVAVFPGSPSLSQPASHITIPATITSLHLAGRKEGEGEGGKVRQLEHEVAVLEQQLSDKTQAARSHVEEVTCMRSELARERAVLARERQESRDAVEERLRRERAAHAEKCRDLMTQLERMRVERREGDRVIGSLRASLKGSESEVLQLSETVSRMSKQLERERESHTSTTRSLHSTAEEGRSKVAELEEALQACQDEVTGHIAQLQELEKAHHAETGGLKSKVASVEETLSGMTVQLQKKTAEVSVLQEELVRARTHHQRQLQDERDTAVHLQDRLTRLETPKEMEGEGVRRRAEELEQALSRSEAVRQSLLTQVEKNGEELERLTQQLTVMEEREGDTEQCRAEAEQLRSMVSELQRGRKEKAVEARESQEEIKRLKVQLGRLQAQLQQARDREAEYSRATGELIKEAGQVRAESGRAKLQLEASQRELEEVRSKASSTGHGLTAQTKKVAEMEQLLVAYQAESTAQKMKLERDLKQCRSDLHTRTQQLNKLTLELSRSQKAAANMKTQLQLAEQTSPDRENQLALKEAELHALRCQLQALRESHSTMAASSEQLVSTHRKAEAQVAEQLQVRQEELSRTRAQVSSLSIELTADRKMTEELRSQLTLARAEAARHQAQVSSMQRAVSLSNMPSLRVSPGLHPHPLSSLNSSPSHTPTVMADKQTPAPSKPDTRSAAGQKKGHIIDL